MKINRSKDISLDNILIKKPTICIKYEPHPYPNAIMHFWYIYTDGKPTSDGFSSIDKALLHLKHHNFINDNQYQNLIEHYHES